MSLHAFPKIFHLGDKYIPHLFEDEVEVTEKIDGSQFVFGKLGGEMHYRSKGAMIHAGNVPKLFVPAVDHIEYLKERIPEGIVFYGETLCKPKHNTLAYDRVPKNNIALFGACADGRNWMTNLNDWATCLEVEAVRVLYKGYVEDRNTLLTFLEETSRLGGQKIEGFVIKNYNQPTAIGTMIVPITSAKYVSERFKEVHQKNWKKDHTGKGQWQTYCEKFKTEARWDKAIIHLKEQGLLEDSPRDIGKLMAEIKQDIIKECQAEIVQKLWQLHSPELLRVATSDLPEWYKKKLGGLS